jgi:hypothetical protein
MGAGATTPVTAITLRPSAEPHAAASSSVATHDTNFIRAGDTE